MDSLNQMNLSLTTPAANVQIEPLQDIILPAFVERVSDSTTHQKFELEFFYKNLDSQQSKLQSLKRSFDFIGGE